MDDRRDGTGAGIGTGVVAGAEGVGGPFIDTCAGGSGGLEAAEAGSGSDDDEADANKPE